MSFAKAWKQEAYTKRKHYIASVKIAVGCADCHIWGPDYILTFDHVRGEKLFGIGQRWDVSQKKLDEEIAKCEVVCFNCHMTRHYVESPAAPSFASMPKIPRLSREMIVTEKIDGTNAAVWVDGDGDVWAGSKNKWLTLEQDNFGFAHWVDLHSVELQELGEGIHRGEWWGSKIQRGYGLTNGERRFSLFNTYRWSDDLVRPACCRVVPVLHVGEFCSLDIEDCLDELAVNGSKAEPGFTKPEGIVVFHVAANFSFKKTIFNDAQPKGKTDVL